MKKTDKETIGVGMAAALIAALCCVGPLILIVLGLGTASTALSIGAQKPYFLVFGLVFFAVSLFLFIKYRRKNICEGVGEVIYNPKQIGWEEITKAVEPYEASTAKDEQVTSADLDNSVK